MLNIFCIVPPPLLPPSHESLIFGNNTVTYRGRVQWFWFATCQASLVLASCETLGLLWGLSFLTALSIYHSNYLYQDSLAKYLAMMKIYYQIYCLLLLMTA